MTQLHNDHYRTLLGDLRAGIEARRQAEKDLAEWESAHKPPPALTLDRELQALEAEQHAAEAAIDQSFAEEKAKLEADLQAQVAVIRADHSRTEQQLTHRKETAVSELQSKCVEDSWLVASVLDEKLAGPEGRYKLLQSHVDSTRLRLQADLHEISVVQAQTLEHLGHCGQPTESELRPCPPAPDRDRALQRFDEAATAVRTLSLRLRRQLLPRLFAGRPAASAWLVAWALLASALIQFVDPRSIGLTLPSQTHWVVIGAVAGLGIMAVIALCLYLLSTQHSASLLAPMQQEAADAAVQYQVWVRFAERDLSLAENEFEARQAAVSQRRDEALRRFAAEKAHRLQETLAQFELEFQATRRKQESALRMVTVLHQDKISVAEAARNRERGLVRSRYERERQRRKQDRQARQAAHAARNTQLKAALQDVWANSLSHLQSGLAALQEENQRRFPAWEALASADWEPPRSLPQAIRVGTWQARLQDLLGSPSDSPMEGDQETLLLPAVLPAPASPSLLLKATGTGKPAAVTVLQLAMLRLLTQFPPGDVRFTVLDPVGLGENFSAFMHLADADELLISSRIWTEPAHIEKQLSLLQEHIENVFQKYLRNDFATIEEYNEHAGEVAEPYHFLIAASFPVGFSERAAQRLRSIVTSGPRCGVHTLLSLDARQPLPRELEVSDLEAAMEVLEWDRDQFVTRSLGDVPFRLTPDPLPSAPLLVTIIRRVGELSRHVRKVEVPFHRIAPREDAWWTGDSRHGIEAPLGRAGATKLQALRLGQGTSRHVVVAGKTGSGKSTLLHVAITNLALRYSPDELHFYLIDLKKGVEFKTYASHALPHARVIAVESDREFGTSVLQRLDAILRERGDLFRQFGVQDVASFRNANPDPVMPRILLVVDEFQEFFVEDDQQSQMAALLLDRLVRQGRAFGIHVLLGSQTLGGAYSLARTTLGQMAVRIALQCSEADAHLILSEDNTAARLLTRPGEALYNDANGMVEGNSPFQIAWLTDEERDNRLSRLSERTAECRGPYADPVIFEGNALADPRHNASFRKLFEAGGRESPPDVVAPRVWLGEAVAITGPTSVTFPARSGANLLIVGQDRDSALGILANVLAALAAQLEPGNESLQLLCGRAEAGRADDWERIVAALPVEVARHTSSQAASVLSGIVEEIARRLGGDTALAPVFLVLDDLGRFRDLRKGDEDYGFGSLDRDRSRTPAQLLGDVLRDGPAVGVHTIVWCDSYNNADRWLSRQALREFEMRVAFQMAATDSSNLLDTPAASRLGANRALLFSDERGTLEKFRPYGPPTDEWLAWIDKRDKEVPEPIVESLAEWVVH